MKLPYPTSWSSWCLAAWLLTTGSKAAEFTWNGASPLGGNDNMTNPANWVGPDAPASNGLHQLIFGGIARNTPNADVDFSINTLRFTSPQGFTIGGNALTFSQTRLITGFQNPFIRNEASVLNRINNNITFTDNGTISAQNGNLTFGGVLGTGPTAGNTVFLNADAGRTLIFNSTIGGFGSLWKTGPGTVRFNASVIIGDSITMGGGTMELSGQITNTSGITFNSGTIRLLANNRIPTLPIDIPAAATLDLNGFSDQIGPISGAGTISLGSGGILTANQSINTTFSGSITGTSGAGLTKSGTGTLTLAGNASYEGPTLVSGGTLRSGGNNSFSNVSVHTIQAGATLNVNGFNEFIGGLAGGGTVSLGNGTLTIGQISNAEFSGSITGSGSLTKTNLSTLRLTGNNSYQGLTTIANGRLVITQDNGLGTDQAGTIVNSGGTLEIASSAIIPTGETLSLAGPGYSGLGALRVHADSSNLSPRINGNLQLTANTTVQTLAETGFVSSLTLGQPAVSGTLALGSNQLSFAGNSTGQIIINHGISGSGGIVWDKPAMLRLNGPNNGHTGPISLLQGSARIDTASGISATGGIITV